MRIAHHPTADNGTDRGCHIHIDANNIVATDRHNIILHTLSFPSGLFPDNPDTAVLHLCAVLRRIMRNHELQSLHSPQSSLESLARLEEVVHVGVAERLHCEGGIIGSLVVEWGFGEVG